MNRRSTANFACLGLGTLLAALALLALTGCSTTPADSDDNIQSGGLPGGGGSTAAPGGSTATTGGGGSTATGNAGAGGGTVLPAGGSGDVSSGGSMAAGGTGGVGGVAGGAGASAGAGGSSSATCDTSTFLQTCLQGGAQWGTEQQSGPCATGTTTYGVTNQLGPYGVRSEYNVGADFNTGNGAGDFAICPVFIASFGADPVGSADLQDLHDLDFGLYSVFYPGCMPEGEKFPLITWGNGTCAMPEGYGPLLRFVASHGYIVVAPNSVQTGSGAQMRKALDFMLAENDKMGSKYYQKIDVDKIGAMGHSQGGMGTVAAADDPRVKAVILWNGGTSASKPFLAVSGDADIAGTVSGMKNAADAAPRPAAWLWYHQIPQAVNGSTTGALAPGHLTLMMESERVNEVAVAWWDMMLKAKPEAKSMFVGDTCTLCDGSAFPSMWAPFVAGSVATPSLEYGHNAMLQ